MAQKRHIPKKTIRIGTKHHVITIEPQFWLAFKRAAAEQDKFLGQLAKEVVDADSSANMSSAIRLYVLGYLEKRLAAYEQTPAAQTAE